MKQRSRTVIMVVLLSLSVLASGCAATGTAAEPEPSTAADATASAGIGDAASAAATSSGTPASTMTPTPKSPPGKKKPVKVMVLGDSISAGAQDEVMNGYRLELLNRLPGYTIDYVGSNERGDDRLADKDMQAEGGACIRADPCNSISMYEQTAGWITAARPNVVIMQGGGNDYCCGRTDQPDSVVIQAMTDWIKLIWATKPDVYIVVIGMIDYHEGYKNWLPTYVKGLASAGKHIAYVSFDGVATYDTVHPNITGYKQLADRLAPVVRPMLDKFAG